MRTDRIAEPVVRRLGGPKNVSTILGLRSRATPSLWDLVPATHHVPLLRYARAHDIPLHLWEMVMPRQTAEELGLVSPAASRGPGGAPRGTP